MLVTGAVLSGGQSRRMGRTKALIDVDGEPMAARVSDALARAGCTDVVLVGGDATELESLGVPLIADFHPGDGPVGGVITALRHHAGASHVVIAACDLPAMTADVVRVLIAAADDSFDVVAAMTDRLEPALAVWSVDATDQVEAAFAGGARAMHVVLAMLRTKTVSVDPAAMRNINRPTDLASASQRDPEGGQ